jgi:hypothetical protein
MSIEGEDMFMDLHCEHEFPETNVVISVLARSSSTQLFLCTKRIGPGIRQRIYLLHKNCTHKAIATWRLAVKIPIDDRKFHGSEHLFRWNGHRRLLVNCAWRQRISYCKFATYWRS